MQAPHSRVERAIGAGVAAVCVWSARHRAFVITAALLATAVFAAGLSQIYVRSADYDLMPDHHPSAIANQHALNEVPGYRSIETVFVETRPGSGPGGGQMNITSPQAIRAANDVENYIRARIPEIRYSYSLTYLVKLVNYTLSGVPNPACNLNGTLPVGIPALPLPLPPQACTPVPPQLSAFQLPANDSDVQRNYDIIARANFGAIQGVVDTSFHGTILVFMYDFNLTRAGPSAVLPASERFLHTVLDYRDHACAASRFTTPNGQSLLNCPHIYVVGEAINAHMTELANQDFLFWGPIVFGATLVVLIFAFGFDWASTLIAALAFSIGLVWTYGLMGYLKIPLTFFGLLIVPITLGVGKEYSIYITNQFLDFRSQGLARDEVFRRVGRGAGAALLVASFTSIVGVATMALSDFFIMRDLAFLTCFSFLALFLIAITFIPAAQALRRPHGAAPFRPSAVMAGLATWISRHRVLVAVVAVAITLGSAVEATQIQEYFGISGGFRHGDYLETSYNYYNAALGGAGTELVVIETGPHQVGDPQTLDYLRATDATFKADTQTIPKASNVNSLIIALQTYYALRDGLANPKALDTALNQNVIPTDGRVVDHDINAAFDSPVWGSLMALFTGRDGNIVVTHIFYHIESETYAGLKRDWDSLNHDVDQVPMPATVHNVNLVGTQDTFYLYVTYGQPWLEYVGYMASFLTLACAIFVVGRARDLVALVPGFAAFFAWFTGLWGHDQALILLAGGAALVTTALLALLRSRAVAAIMVPMMLASVWWAGLLPLFGIKASLTLMLPTVFLISVGSDYAIQYVWNHRQEGDMVKVYGSTGKANLYVVAATVLAFALFIPMKLVLSSQGAAAAALAILTIFAVTTLLVPLFYGSPAVDAERSAAKAYRNARWSRRVARQRERGR
ncbi:MAG: MMPL family transporter [Thermoplasmatota archaeon]